MKTSFKWFKKKLKRKHYKIIKICKYYFFIYNNYNFKILSKLRMRSWKIIKLLCIFVVGFYTLPLFWAEGTEFCETIKDPFELYKCRIDKICEQYKKDSIPVYENAKYKKAEDYKEESTTNAWKINLFAFEEVKKLYNTTISNQYKCAIINTQIRQLWEVTKLIAVDKTGNLKNEIGKKIEDKISKNKMTLQTLKCNSTDSIKWINQVKTNILKQTTYETCNYVLYLEYLKTYYDNAETILNLKWSEQDAQTNFPIEYIVKSIVSAKTRFTEEKERVMELQPIVFSAYTEYENNYLTHLYLELIKADFSIIRTRWNAAIAPINQVVYKISNAMKK